MMDRVDILCAMRDTRLGMAICREMDDELRCAVRVVSRGDEALRSACEMPPDIMVIDALLPGIDGLGVMDGLRAKLSGRTPRVIGGSMMPFSDEGFLRRGAKAVLRVPWNEKELKDAIRRQIEEIRDTIDWDAAEREGLRAQALLEGMGMSPSLKGFAYLSMAAALAYQQDMRLCAVGERLYRPIAARCGTTQQAVERLIRHAMESAMGAAGAEGMYAFFGNTIDPTKGKPTNAQCIFAMVEKMKSSANGSNSF